MDSGETFISSKRAVRRAHRRRVIRNRSAVFKRYGDNERYFKQLAKTATPCSCFLCGHTRKHFGVTMQEKRKMQEQIASLIVEAQEDSNER